MASPTKEKLNTITGYATDEGYQVRIGGTNILYYKNNDDDWQKIMDGDPEVIGFKSANIRVMRQYDEHNIYIAIWGQKETVQWAGYIYRVNLQHPERMILMGIIPHWYNDMEIVHPNEIYLAGVKGTSITHFNGNSFNL